MPGVTSKLIYDQLAGEIEKSMCSRADVISTIEKEKHNIEVLVSLGAGDIENDIAQIKQILTKR